MKVCIFFHSLHRKDYAEVSMHKDTQAEQQLKPKIVEIKLLFLDGVELEEYVESIDLGLVSKEELKYFTILALNFLQEDSIRQEELKVS